MSRVSESATALRRREGERGREDETAGKRRNNSDVTHRARRDGEREGDGGGGLSRLGGASRTLETLAAQTVTLSAWDQR